MQKCLLLPIKVEIACGDRSGMNVLTCMLSKPTLFNELTIHNAYMLVVVSGLCKRNHVKTIFLNTASVISSWLQVKKYIIKQKREAKLVSVALKITYSVNWVKLEYNLISRQWCYKICPQCTEEINVWPKFYIPVTTCVCSCGFLKITPKFFLVWSPFPAFPTSSFTASVFNPKTSTKRTCWI